MGVLPALVISATEGPTVTWSFPVPEVANRLHFLRRSQAKGKENLINKTGYTCQESVVDL